MLVWIWARNDGGMARLYTCFKVLDREGIIRDLRGWDDLRLFC